MASTNELHVIFGTGPLGKWTARELIHLGHQVRLVTRLGTTTDLPAGAAIVVSACSIPPSLANASM